MLQRPTFEPMTITLVDQTVASSDEKLSSVYGAIDGLAFANETD
jgi:hypothetical protein